MNSNLECTCPICGSTMKDTEVIYMREALVIVDFLSWKTMNQSQAISDCSLKINHTLKQVILNYVEVSKEKDEKFAFAKKTIELEKYYHTLEDPYVQFE